MTFQNLRTGNQLYILHKDSIPTLEIGKVITLPISKYGTYDMLIDISAEVNGTTTNFQKLPANKDIVDFGNNIVLACSKESMEAEITAMKQKSLTILDSVEEHQNIVKSCEEILVKLNPEALERQNEIKALREEIGQLKELIKGLKSHDSN